VGATRALLHNFKEWEQIAVYACDCEQFTLEKVREMKSVYIEFFKRAVSKKSTYFHAE